MQRETAIFGQGKPTPRLTLVRPEVNGHGGTEKSWAQAWQGGDILALTYDLGGKEQISDPYAESPVVNRCINLIATNIAAVPLKLWGSDDEDAKEVDEGDPLLLPLRKPNPWMTWEQLITLTTIQRLSDPMGESFWFLFAGDASGGAAPGSTPPKMIWPFPGSAVTEKKDKDGQIVAWKTTAGATTYEFPREAVLQFRAPNPKNPLRGMSPLKPLERVLQMAWTADRYQEGLLRNGGDPGGFIHIPAAVQPADRALLEAQADDHYNNPAMAGRVRVLDNGATYQPNPSSSKDVQYLEGHAVWKKDICLVLGVPALCVDLDADGGTFANKAAAFRQLWRVTLVPQLREYENVLNTWYLQPRGKYVARFDLSGVEELKEDNLEKVKTVVDMTVNGPGLSFNEGAAMVGLEVDPPEHGDTHFMASMAKPIDGDLGEQAKADEEARQQAERDAFARQDAARVQEDAPEKSTRRDVLAKVRAPGPDHRRAYWKSFSARVLHPSSTQIELAARRFLKKYADAQRARVRDFAEHGHAAKGFSKDFSPAQLDALLLDPKEWALKFEKIVKPALVKAWELSLASASDDVGGAFLDVTDPRVMAKINTQLVKLTEGVNGTLAEKVRTAISEVLSAPSTIHDMQDAVRELLPKIEGTALEHVFGNNHARALAIARTESSHAANTARVTQYEEAGIEEIEWIHGGAVTEDSREEHVALDGTKVRLGETFSNGLKYPHDPDAPASEVVNCTCISAAVIE